jgi:hypothetical protein
LVDSDSELYSDSLPPIAIPSPPLGPRGPVVGSRRRGVILLSSFNKDNGSTENIYIMKGFNLIIIHININRIKITKNKFTSSNSNPKFKLLNFIMLNCKSKYKLKFNQI